MTAAPKVHVHSSSPESFFVNSFVIEGEKSLILVDTQFVLSEARMLSEKIDALGKPLAAVFITHPHPDHYNGLATILAKNPGTHVHATAATLAGIRETAEPKRAYWTPIVGADYPQTFAMPDVAIQDGEKLNIDGVELSIEDFGPTECSDNTAIALPQIDAVIVSDLVYNRVHPWLAEGRSELWLSALAKAMQRFGSAKTLYAGHGGPGPVTIIDQQANYINAVRDMVAEAAKTDPELSDGTRSKIQQKVLDAYSNWPLEAIIGMNTAGLATEIRVQTGRG